MYPPLWHPVLLQPGVEFCCPLATYYIVRLNIWDYGFEHPIYSLPIPSQLLSCVSRYCIKESRELLNVRFHKTVTSPLLWLKSIKICSNKTWWCPGYGGNLDTCHCSYTSFTISQLMFLNEYHRTSTSLKDLWQRHELWIPHSALAF